MKGPDRRKTPTAALPHHIYSSLNNKWFHQLKLENPAEGQHLDESFDLLMKLWTIKSRNILDPWEEI